MATSIILSLILLFQGAHISLAFVLLFAFAVFVLAILGDLFESLLERNAGIKDTGDILSVNCRIFILFLKRLSFKNI